MLFRALSDSSLMEMSRYHIAPPWRLVASKCLALPLLYLAPFLCLFKWMCLRAQVIEPLERLWHERRREIML